NRVPRQLLRPTLRQSTGGPASDRREGWNEPSHSMWRVALSISPPTGIFPLSIGQADRSGWPAVTFQLASSGPWWLYGWRSDGPVPPWWLLTWVRSTDVQYGSLPGACTRVMSRAPSGAVVLVSSSKSATVRSAIRQLQPLEIEHSAIASSARAGAAKLAAKSRVNRP